MAVNKKAPEIPAACAEQIEIALALFRSAALNETAEEAILPLVNEAILPLSDPGLRTALSETESWQRAMGAIRSLNQSGGIRPVVQRVDCFLRLLTEQNQNPHSLWKELVTDHNRFLPIVQAIAWCPAYEDEAFDVVLFAKIASNMRSAPMCPVGV